MEIYKQRNKLKYIHFIYHRYILLICCASISCLASSSAHFIHIDHNEFRAHGYPRPPLPPPLPSVDQLHHQHLPIAKELTPAEFMVDLTNDLTYRIMHYHSILNRNNFAFSPTALMSVLVALYEGSTGRSATEMRNVLQLPNNRDIIRVGYRDIHRRLRTYFFGSENPLKGLSLNKDNVTISRDYETILMFYGYDLGMDMVSSTMPPTTTTTTEPTVPDALTSVNASSTSTTIAPMTTTSAADTDVKMTTIVESDEKSTTTEAPTTITPLTTSTTTTTTTEPPQTTVEATTEEPATTEATSSEMETTTEAAETTTTTEASSTEAVAAADNEGENGEAKTNGEVAELVSSFVAVEDAEPLLRIQKARVSRLPSSKLQVPLAKSSYPKVNYLPSARYTTAAINSRGRSRSRNKRHLLGGYKELDANLFVTLFHPQTSTALQNHHNHGLFSIAAPAPGSLIASALQNNEFETTVDIEPSYLNAGGAVKQNYNTDIISHVFYLSSQQLVHTTFKVYNAVLYYKYFENLKMHVLELELNTPEYNLIILLPDFNTDLVTAAASLRLGPTLRLMRKELKPRWVQAIIPDFKLHGTMFLTNDLQNMGICDIFEPNRADFRPMTDENGIYVKHIEQSINVNIRTRPINQLKHNADQQTQPIQISVNHPFLFFIIDRDLDVAVMAGRILNPLNVRIQ